MSLRGNCPIWGTPASVITLDDGNTFVNSPRVGGNYVISDDVRHDIANLDDHTRVHLTTWLLEQRRFGERCPRIANKTIDNIQYFKIAKASERADSLLRYLESRSQKLGEEIVFSTTGAIYDKTPPDEDYRTFLELLSHSRCIEGGELFFLLSYLDDRKLISFGGVDNPPWRCSLTISGFSRLAELEATNSSSSRAFIAMWFDPTLNDAWENGFSVAVRQAGYVPIRIDKQEHIGKIDDEIIAEIRKARFVVADFTQGDKGARGGVYYEAGFAHGLNVPVIFTCKEDSINDVHLDTRQFNHIVWRNAEEIRIKLSTRIEAVIGEGPEKPSN